MKRFLLPIAAEFCHQWNTLSLVTVSNECELFANSRLIMTLGRNDDTLWKNLD